MTHNNDARLLLCLHHLGRLELSNQRQDVVLGRRLQHVAVDRDPGWSDVAQRVGDAWVPIFLRHER